MPDLFEEIKEDIKQEKLAKLWQDTGNYIIAAIIGVITITAGSVAYKNYKVSKHENLGTKLYSAYSKESNLDATKAINEYETISKTADANISALANMRQAYLLANNGQQDKATQLYKDISENQKNPQEIRELAEILYLNNAIEFSENNDVSLIERLEDIAKSDGPFKYSAKEMLAFILYDSQQHAEARQLFVELTEAEATPTRMRGRAREMADAIKIKPENVEPNAEDANG